MISASCCPLWPHEPKRPDPPRRSSPPNSYTTSRDTTQSTAWGSVGEDKNVQAYPDIHRRIGSGPEGCRSWAIACKEPQGPRNHNHGNGGVPHLFGCRDYRCMGSWAG